MNRKSSLDNEAEEIHEIPNDEDSESDDDEEPIILLVLQELPGSVSQQHASDLLHSMAASKDILFWTPRGELLRNQRRIPKTSISELLEHLLLPFSNDVRKPRALNSFLEGLAELGINKKWIKNKKALREILDKEKILNRHSEEITDSDDIEESSMNSEHSETEEEESEDSESDEALEEDEEQEDENSEQDFDEEKPNDKKRCDHCDHQDVDEKMIAACPKCHWHDALSNPSPRFNMILTCPICKHKFPLNYDTAKSYSKLFPQSYSPTVPQFLQSHSPTIPTVPSPTNHTSPTIPTVPQNSAETHSPTDPQSHNSSIWFSSPPLGACSSLGRKAKQTYQGGKDSYGVPFYKFLDDTTSFAMIDSSKASDFQWDCQVCEFFETIKYLSGQKTRNFLRGPGFHGTGKGGKKQFTTFADFNLCGPSQNISKHCKDGYTTDSGIIKTHLQSFHAFSRHPKADINYLVNTDKVQVIGVSLPMDGTALKPGLEFDVRQKKIIGLTYNVDSKYVSDNTVPDPEEIKKNLVTSAEVTFMTSVDNSSTMSVGVHYHPKSVSGAEMLSQIIAMGKTVQVCERCLNKQPAHNHIVTHETAQCNSKCESCLELKDVCQDCKEKGHLSFIPALRCCETCLEESAQCRKVAVLVVVTDCEECNKQALLHIQTMSESSKLPAELLLLTPLPDVVHVGAKNPNCCGGLYRLSMETTAIDIVLENSTGRCGEIKKVSRNESNGALVFTDVEARNVKSFDPITLEITHLAGDGNSIDLDGIGVSCSFIQVIGICCIANTIFVTDAAAGKVKIKKMVSLAGTCEILFHMGMLYNSFSIGCKGSPSMAITPENVVSNVKQVHQYIQSTINKVKESKQLKKEASTNGPEGTVSVKTQVSIELLSKGIHRLLTKITDVNKNFKEKIEWKTLLTTHVEHLHAVSHFKHETFSTLQYATDFGTIAKESLKRASKWAAKYFTHPSSYYPVPQTGMSLCDIKFMTPLPTTSVPIKDEDAMREWFESYRPIRQRTVRSETTKDKAGALPPAVYRKPPESSELVSFQASLLRFMTTIPQQITQYNYKMLQGCQ
ncbi:hypothetical protein AC249_AIPGENE20523 [Exaiptasia diaphana]|nr:hypothetical protein AC249_AIPGENE20523 [Exaiptasia diaphana]